jgi:hypothetical protein
MRNILGVVALLAAGAAGADDGLLDICMQERHCRTASSGELEQLRGGFEVNTSAGRMRFDIGITRAVALNDRLVGVSHHGSARHTARNQEFLSQLAGPGVSGGPVLVNTQPARAGGPVVVQDNNALIVQSGERNFAPPASSFGANSFPIIVQNTLDNTNLKTFTLINASVNSLSLMRSLATNDMMRRATIASGR